MDLLILDKFFNTLSVLDTYESLIWTERYQKCGDFEIYAPVNIPNFEDFQIGNYLYRKNIKRMMIVETLQIETDAETGDRVIVTGESLESILKRRIVKTSGIINGNLQSGVHGMLYENVMSTLASNRLIPNFTFVYSTDPEVTALTLNADYTGETVYDAIESACSEKGIGFRIYPNFDGDAPAFSFELYAGKNRAYSQDTLPWVAFTPKFDNFLSSNYIESKKDYKTTCIVHGMVERDSTYTDSNGETQTYTYTENLEQEVDLHPELTGLERRELYLDVGSMNGTDDDGNEISTAQLKLQMTQKGKEALTEYPIVKSFESSVDPNHQYVYGKDFFIGDIVQVANSYNKEGECRIAEIVYSKDTTGERIIPTFTAIEKEEEK